MILSIPIPKDEEIIMKEQGLFEHGISWKPGHLYLTNKRIIFAQGARIFFQAGIKNLVLCEIVKRKCILGKRVKQLRFVFESRNVCIATRSVDDWVSVIGEIKKGE